MSRNLIIAGVAVAAAVGVFTLVAAFAVDAQIPGMAKMPAGIPGMSGASVGSPAKGILGKASDAALDKLSKPGAFSADSAIRIGLPGQAKSLGGVMKFAGQAGVGGDIDASLNEAAGQAASAAKPVFRAAIDHMSMQDMVGIGTGGGTGATDYLKKSAGSEIKAQIAPLVQAALGKTGVLGQSSKFSALGISPATLIDYVTGKTADGIFLYMGREETSIRANPMKAFGH